jgi:hypothetical protein
MISSTNPLPILFSSSSQIRWDLNRSKLAWRWNWLQLQFYELSRQLDICDQECTSLRTTKAELRPTIDLPNDEEDTPATKYCLRTVPLTSISSHHRKLTCPPVDPYVFDCEEDHPLFSIHGNTLHIIHILDIEKRVTGKIKRAQLLGNAYKHRNKKRDTHTDNSLTGNAHTHHL